MKSTNTLRTVCDLRYIYLAYYYSCAKKVSLRIVERNYDSGNKEKNIRKNEELERDD